MDRVWWENVLRVLTRPGEVFAALRPEDDDAADARAEPINLLVLLAGIATVSWAPATGRLLDDPAIDSLLVAVLLFLTGALYGFAGYLGLGVLTRVGLAAVGVSSRGRQVRHALVYAAVPVALSIVLLPVRLALYGRGIFERGGEAGDVVLGTVEVGLVAWSLALLALALRVVYSLSWPRAAAAAALPALVAVVAVAGAA